MKKVIDGDYIVEKVESIRLYPNGQNGEVQLLIDGQEKKRMQFGTQHRVDLLDAHDAVGVSDFKLVFNETRIHIKQRRIEYIKNCEVIEHIDSIRNLLEKNVSVDWKKNSNIRAEPSWNTDEQRFIEGFFEYYHSCTMKNDEKTGKLKAERLEEAFGKLYPFSTCSSLANEAIAAICLYFNWFDKLSRICNDHTPYCFLAGCAFLQSPMALEKAVSDRHRKKINIYIEPDLYENLMAMQSFVEGDIESVQSYLTRILPRLQKGEIAPNLADKIWLLKARYALKERDIKDAQYYYSQIKFYQSEKFKEEFNVK